MAQALPLVVFSHLRWSWVFQRPQQLMTRLARTRPILFVEEPQLDRAANPPRWEGEVPYPNVQVWRPRTAIDEPGFTAAQLRAIGPILPDLKREQALEDCLAWLYTPLALPLAMSLAPRCLIYDCMDELSAFRGAPPELVECEQKVFAAADLVFTGGPSLFEAKRARHPRVHCFPSSVDAAHFGQARRSGPEPAAQAALPRPRLGYFGVIDERCDLELIRQVAEARPEWQMVMVGPVTKVDPADLPRRENIHYFGQQPYDALPDFLRGWDVCLLPFARNEATRYISPTKTLEYMAAEKPIVSTPIRDVAEPYGAIVRIAESPAEFVAACAAALAESEAEGRQRAAGMQAVLGRTSWERTAATMNDLIEEAARPRKRSAPAPATRRSAPLVIVGAGPTGLSAAYHAGPDCLLLEREDRVGGWCRSLVVNGFTFDYAGHIMFSNDADVHEMYRKLLGDNVHWQDREAFIYSKNVFTRYPFQGALYGLPPEVIKECIVGAIEARFGSLNGKAEAACGQNGNGVHDCCADGVLESTAALGRRGNGHAAPQRPPDNFEDFIYNVWGAGIAKHFAIPYNRKLWAVPLHEMETSWLGGRVPLPDLQEMIEGALRPVPKPMGPNARFGYPLRGGFQALMDGFLPHVRDRLRLNSAVTALSPRRQAVTVNGTEQIRYERLISTMPLPVLMGMIGDEAPAAIHEAAGRLRNVSVRCVHIGVGREKLTEKHWIYYPEDTVFHRIFVQGNASPHCNPHGGFGLTCEITYSPSKPLPCDGEALVQRCIRDCIEVGLIREDDPIWAAVQCDLPYAYVVYDHARAASVRVIREWLQERGIIVAGRYGEWEYYNSDHAFLAGRKAVENAAMRPGGGRGMRPGAAIRPAAGGGLPEALTGPASLPSRAGPASLPPKPGTALA